MAWSRMESASRREPSPASARSASANLSEGIANATGLGGWLLRGTAVERHCQNAGDSGLADSTMSAEDISVSNSLLRNRILKGAGDVLLADNVGEFLRPVFTRQYLIAHPNP